MFILKISIQKEMNILQNAIAGIDRANTFKHPPTHIVLLIGKLQRCQSLVVTFISNQCLWLLSKCDDTKPGHSIQTLNQAERYALQYENFDVDTWALRY